MPFYASVAYMFVFSGQEPCAEGNDRPATRGLGKRNREVLVRLLQRLLLLASSHG